MSFYRPSDAGSTYPLSQGDVLQGIPFTAFSISNVSIVDDKTTKLVDLGAGEHTRGALIAQFELSWGLLLNQSCDLDHTKTHH
jgi:hypothetical protein